MTVTLKSFIIAFVLVILSVAIYRYAQLHQQEPTSDLSTLPTFSAEGFEGQSYDQDGLIVHKLKASHIDYYSKVQRLELENPVLKSYDHLKNGQTETWFLSGNYGQVFINDKAIIEGEVRLYPGFFHPNLKEITANKLNYNFKNDVVTSQDRVTITGHDFVNSGTNFSADLQNNTMKYKGEPHVIYYPQKN